MSVSQIAEEVENFSHRQSRPILKGNIGANTNKLE